MVSLLTSTTRFFSLGAVNTAVGYSVMLLVYYGLGFNPYLANLMGYGVGLICSYVGSKYWVFRTANQHGPRVFHFFASWCVAFSVNMLVLKLFLALLPYELLWLSQLISMASFTCTHYVLCRVWVFSPRVECADR
jgi:putative flippase GtrA